MRFLLLAIAGLGLLLVGMLLWRASDKLRDAAAWQRLADLALQDAGAFDPDMLSVLPEPAQRYFKFSIAPGTRLSRVAVFEMEGELGLGDKADPKYRSMRAQQILAAPDGLVWRLSAGPISGSDGALPKSSWTRFWLFHLVPIVRIAGDADHHRSAFGRVVAEAAFWTPAALLPSDTVSWEARGPDTARAVLLVGGFTQWVEITVDEQGAPTEVLIERWSNANPDKAYRLQPFGGTLGGYRAFDGFRVPTRVEGGNFFGTAGYFPFFKATVTDMRFL